MATVENLLSEITEVNLRKRLVSEFEELKSKKKFGLVYEKHLPEIVYLNSKEINIGDSVVENKSYKSNKIIWKVVGITELKAKCIADQSLEIAEFDLQELIVIARFGETIFPSLQKVNSVKTSPEKNSNVLIQADNYHALQLLEYIYPSQIDCIYIDPPYNTGAKDWKYNNNYVDENDQFRHSKWISFMERRLKLAKKLLKKNGALITAIDDNEFSHVWMLLKELFPNHLHIPVTAQHNPGGTQGDGFSVMHEYLIFTIPKDLKLAKKPHYGGDTYNLRRWGSTSGRYEGKTTFYPIYLDEFYNVIGFGEVASNEFHPKSQTVKTEFGYEVWPIDKNNIEKKWRYGRDTVETVKNRMFTIPSNDRIEIKLRREDEPPKTVWTDKLYNAEAHGTVLLSKFIDTKFSYPKSLYAVRDALNMIVKENKNARVLDFFAGSGTTMHALSLLNKIDKGDRQCILVTNNELSDKEEKELSDKNFFPGDIEWEKYGICQSVTFPRIKNAIEGKRGNVDLEGYYYSGRYINKKIKRKFFQLSFLNPEELNSVTKKKELVALIGSEKLPKSSIKVDTKYIISEKHSSTIILDTDYEEEWCNKLIDHDGIAEVYIVTSKKNIFNKLKEKIESLLDPLIEFSEEEIPFSEGLSENLEFFDLKFLDKNSVTLGENFYDILPILWMKAGAKGYCPEANQININDDFIVLENNNMAILFAEDKFSRFTKKIKSIENIFIVTNSNELFIQMAETLKGKKIVQLYKDYLDNFSILNGG